MTIVVRSTQSSGNRNVGCQNVQNVNVQEGGIISYQDPRDLTWLYDMVRMHDASVASIVSQGGA